MSASIQQQILQKRKDLKEMYKMKTSISNGTICTDGAMPYLSSIREETTLTTDFTERPIPKDCSIIMNGHYKMDSSQQYGGKDDCEEYYAGEETRPFLDGQSKKRSKKQVHVFTDESNDKSAVDSGTVNLASTDDSTGEDTGEDSVDEGGEEMPETHLLRASCNDPVSDGSPNFKVTVFKPSPKKSTESRSHIQHRPLGLQPSPAYSLQEGKQKIKWSAVKCMGSIMITFVVCMFVSVMTVTMLSGPSRCKPDRDWWQDVVSYEVFPASFQDTDNDGFGDIRGVVARADYIKNLSVDVLRLNSIFSALDYPLEYEHVIDFTNVDPHLGRLADFKDLVSAFHSRGMFIVLDLNPTVTSDQHSWAAHWLLHRTGRYDNYYVNYTDDKMEPPMENKIVTLEGDVLKERANPHRTFGSHIYLNWSNPFVQEELQDVLRYWLSLGVDGFYMKHLEELKLDDPTDIEIIVSGWRDVLDEFSANTTRKILAGSAVTLQSIQEKHGLSDSMMSHFDVVDVGIDFTIDDIGSTSSEVTRIRKWVAGFSKPPWIWWHFGSVETPRLATRVGEKYALNSVFVLALLPGTVSLFYGDEIALKDTYEVASRKVYKGGQLTLMQWSPSANGNFTHGNVKPWLPVHPDFPKADFNIRSRNIVLLSRLLYLKKSTLQQTTRQRSPLGTIVRKIEGRPEPDQPTYSWSTDTQNDLLIIDLHHKTEKQALLVSNFGKNSVRLSEIALLKKTSLFNTEVHGLRLVLPTDNTFPTFDTSKGVLHPGNSVLCIYDR